MHGGDRESWEFQMQFTFVVESMIRGYHEYKTVWEDPVLAEELRCMRKIGNPHDPMAVAIQKNKLVVIWLLLGTFQKEFLH